MKKYIAFVLLAACCFAAMAQGRIDKVINSLEDKRDVSTTYTERRSPKKHQLIMTSRIFNFDNPEYYKKLAKAMEDERNCAVSAVKTKTQMTFRFEDSKGISSYTLTCSDNGSAPYVMVMTWRSIDSRDSSLMDLESDPNTVIYSYDDDAEMVNAGCNEIMWTDGDNVWHKVVYDNESVANARQEAANARREAAKLRREAEKMRREANRMAAKARREAAREASKCRREAAKEAAKARREAMKEAAKARREAAKIRRRANENRKNYKIVYGDGNESVIYQL